MPDGLEVVAASLAWHVDRAGGLRWTARLFLAVEMSLGVTVREGNS